MHGGVLRYEADGPVMKGHFHADAGSLGQRLGVPFCPEIRGEDD